jgi:hypothetical protein
MKKRFVVLIESSTKEQNEIFLNWIKSEGVGWFYWFQNAWLLTNIRGHLSASDIRDQVGHAYGQANTIVLELQGGNDTWAGFGPNTEKRDMFKWINANWNSGD